jgi:hemerythrin-like domain-containing protein
MDNVVTLIKNDHATFEWFFTKLESEDTPTEEKTELLHRLEAVLVPHSRAEEQVVYPAIETAVPSEDDEVKDSRAEHQHVDGLMAELKAQPIDAPGADGILAAMIGELRHHIEEEEQDILPEYSEAVDGDELDRVGREFRDAKERVRLEHGFPEAERPDLIDLTRDELYDRAKAAGVTGGSSMTKDELVQALNGAE